MAEEVKRRCDSCRFWAWEGDGDDRGQCRRLPPTIETAGAIIRGLVVIQTAHAGSTVCDEDEAGKEAEYQWAAWPVTHWNHWCGAWECGNPTARKPEDGLPPEVRPDPRMECKPNG